MEQVFLARKTTFIVKATSLWKYGRVGRKRLRKVGDMNTALQTKAMLTGSARRMSLDVKFELPPLMEGVESDVDRMLLQHFVSRASAVLSLHGDQTTNPFTKILLPMALQHEGLMHSVLCLSASHLCSLSP